MSSHFEVDERILHARAIVRAALDGLNQGEVGPGGAERLITLVNALSLQMTAIVDNGEYAAVSTDTHH